MKSYEFESANMGTVGFAISGECGNTVDMEVTIDGTGSLREFADVDGGTVDDMFEWLIDQGVEFESDRSMWFNAHYVAV